MEIKTRESLKMFFFKFHNNVNKRKKQKEESITILDKYKTAVMVNVYLYFKQEFFRRYFVANHFSGWIRNMMYETIVNFFSKNISQFHP